MAKYKTRLEQKRRRHNRIRRKISGTPERPRLCVNFSNKHVYLQLVDDEKAQTLLFLSSLNKEFREKNIRTNIQGVEEIARVFGEKIKESGIKAVVFDRGGFKYHGRIRAVADAVRKAGIIC